MRKLTIISICLVLIFGFSFSSSAVASDQDDVLNVVTKWATAFNTSNIKLYSSVYSPEFSIFTPPKSGAFLSQGGATLEKDMESMFAMPKGTYSVSCHNTQATMLGNNHAVITGYIVFTFNPPAVEEQTVAQCRRTLVVQKINGKWLIVHEHASLFPTE